jgi:hypothetical protein
MSSAEWKSEQSKSEVSYDEASLASANVKLVRPHHPCTSSVYANDQKMTELDCIVRPLLMRKDLDPGASPVAGDGKVCVARRKRIKRMGERETRG